MRKLTLATAALLIASSFAATAQTSGTASQDNHKGPAQEGGRTQATPGASSTTGGTPMDTTGSTTPRSGTASQDNHKGPAQEGGRTQATPGATR